MYAIAVHGGAGTWGGEHEAEALQGVRRAAEAGTAILAGGGSALDAAVAAVVLLEDDPLFNAGTGSALNVDGEAEMDAGVMVGQGLRSGNVACLQRVKNPILVARKVMEETDHVLLAGEGALRFARAMGFADHDPVTPRRLADWQERRKEGARLPQILANHPELAKGTVGAVARDAGGGLAAATSTGGVTLKLAGRVGDTPLPGAGTYATPSAAASATGRGELMMRFLATRAVCDRIAAGRSAQQAVDEVVAEMAASLGPDVGIIALDGNGGIGVAHATPHMPHAFASWYRDGVTARLRVEPA